MVREELSNKVAFGQGPEGYGKDIWERCRKEEYCQEKGVRKKTPNNIFFSFSEKTQSSEWLEKNVQHEESEYYVDGWGGSHSVGHCRIAYEYQLLL